nr:hypothetical protein B0A51_07185 [Rachicladosporium sp. CCFEE 5018]
MARLTRKRARSPEPAQEEDPDQHQDGEFEKANDAEPEQALQFDEPLTWKAGRGAIPVADLLRRLKKLYDEMASLEQFGEEDAALDQLIPKATELTSSMLLMHKDKGVRAYALACIVQTFRLLAPNAPYNPKQLKEIFTLFVTTVLPALACPSDPYQQQHLAALESLSAVRSIALLADIPGADALIVQLFANCFDVLSGNMKGATGENIPKAVEYHMTNVLVTLVQECEKLPLGVVEIILAQFLRADPATLAQAGKRDIRDLADISPAYNMARSVCSGCASEMKGAIGQYFSGVLLSASEVSEEPAKHGGSKMRGRKRTHAESEDESDDGMLTPPTEVDFDNAERAHRLLRELWRAASEVVETVVPQLEPQMKAENVRLRAMAVQTVGDMVAGIGAAGPAPPIPLAPAAYPSHSLDRSNVPPASQTAIYKPIAPHAFSSTYGDCYLEFVSRHNDKAAVVRCAWAAAAARILLTSAGGIGLDTEQELRLLRLLNGMLIDTDEKVRLAVIEAIATFDFDTIAQKVGKLGGVAAQGSILRQIADRIKDPKAPVRAAAIELLADIWGVAAGAIGEGSEQMSNLFAAIPSEILSAVYVNSPQINASILEVLHKSLVPTAYPMMTATYGAIGGSGVVVDNQLGGDPATDVNALRVERMLVFVRCLDDRATAAFFNLQRFQCQGAAQLCALLKLSEASHSSEDSSTDKKTNAQIDAIVGSLTKMTTDFNVAKEHLRMYLKHNHRRGNQLIRFCCDADSDYRKVCKAMKEFRKKMEESPSPLSSTLSTMDVLLDMFSMLLYNRTHVPAMLAFARTDEKRLGEAATKVIKDLSTTAPKVFELHIREYCEMLKQNVPTEATPNDPSATQVLKAISDFVQHDASAMPNDRELYKALSAYTLYGSPPKAAKHAVRVMLASDDKKEMYTEEILEKCLKDFTYGSYGFLARLASLSQVVLLSNAELDTTTQESVTDTAVGKILREIRTPAEEEDADWTDEPDEELSAKLLALTILVNNVRGQVHGDMSEDAKSALKTRAIPVYKLLNTIIQKEGELSKTPDTISTPNSHKAQLRLSAAVQIVKLCCHPALDALFSDIDFNRLTTVVQDPRPEVRNGFAKAIQKYLVAGKLQPRFNALIFMYAFEPSKTAKDAVAKWAKSRSNTLEKVSSRAMRTTFARFLSLLAHHLDFSMKPEELADNVEYILFYLKNVATVDNLPHIHHLAQRLKSVQDGINPAQSGRLYVLSELAEAVIRKFAEEKGWNLQLFSGKDNLPRGPFIQLPSHESAQEISERRYLPEELAEELDDLVKASLKPPKKHKAERTDGDGSSKPAAKKAKTTSSHAASKRSSKPKTAKTPKKQPATVLHSSERRKSTRQSHATNYAEESDSEAEEGAERWDEYADENKENESSTPPTSDPAPITKPAEKAKPKAKAPAAAATRKLPRRGAVGKARKEKDIMDVPVSDEEMSDPLSEMEA